VSNFYLRGDITLVGITEIAEMFEFSRRRAHAIARYDWADAAPFPAPIAELSCGPVWLKDEVLGWATTWDRRIGNHGGTRDDPISQNQRLRGGRDAR
jgi:hypothetical protein